VLATIRRLLAAGRDLRAVMVVRPDTVERLPDCIEFLRQLGVRHVTPSLDLWARWTREDAGRLESAIIRCANLWRSGLPQCSISWFDDKAAMLAGVPSNETARCGFGHVEIAVAPSGNLYPCPRDRSGTPLP
jgi:sulfatase maturation enzyme AslB (radical SAM superfamily)